MRTRIEMYYEIVMFILALISVSIIWIENESYKLIDIGVWIIFVLDFCVRFIKAENKLKYIVQNPFDLIAIIPLDSIFRLARLARLFRIIRAITIAAHFGKPFFAILRTNGLHKVVTFIIILIFLSSIPISLLEPDIDSFQDAIWWSIVTATTVGYGDYSPETAIGRIIAIILMVMGIGLIGMVTSSISTYFMSNNTPVDHELDKIKRSFEHINDWTSEDFDRTISFLNKQRASKER